VVGEVSERVFRGCRLVDELVVDVEVQAARDVPVLELLAMADVEDEDVRAVRL
jgi:hypothetical protein